MKVVISGAGIAGPTLAYWLSRDGHEVLLIEQASTLRDGGYLIDFWGVGYDIAERMGLLPRLHSDGYQVREVRFVDEHGHKNGGFSAEVFRRLTDRRFTSLRRADLSAAIYASLDATVERLFGDSITGIEESPSGARVTFARAAPRDVDLVIGADGLHSQVRHILYGPEAKFERRLGYHVAAFDVGGYQPRDELAYVSYAMPGAQVSRFAMREDKTLILFVFRDEFLRGLSAAAARDPRAALTAVFADAGWECRRMLDAMLAAGEIYFDRVSQIRMDHWTRGRTALVGDAAACVSLLAGEGSGLAMAEAYVLADALRRADGKYGDAFARYETALMPFVTAKQNSATRFASSFVPGTAAGIWFRNVVTRLLRIPPIATYFIGRDLRDNLALPECH